MNTDDESEELQTRGQLVPRRPAALRAKAGDGAATLWWSVEDSEANAGADESLFAKTETFIVYKYRLDGEEWKERGDRVEIAFPATSVTVDGLTNGRTYQFTVRARSRKGVCSAESLRSSNIIPYSPLPEPWQERFDNVNGKAFYFNPETKQTTYTRPQVVEYPVGDVNRTRFQPKDIKKMRLLFSEVDVDGSGTIEESELESLLKELDLGNSVSSRRRRRLFRAADPKGTGRLEFDQFLSLVHNLENPSLIEKLFNPKIALGDVATKLKPDFGEKARLERTHKRKMHRLERMGPWETHFDEARRRNFYVNKDTKEKVWVLPEEVIFWHPKELDEVFNVHEIAEMREMFENYDQDRSGEMDADELTEALRDLGDRSVTHAAVLKLIQEVDQDGSGELNFAEFLQVVANRKKSKQPIVFKIPLIGGTAGDAEFRDVSNKLTEALKENTQLKVRVEELELELEFMRRKELVFVPVSPLHEFLTDNNLLQYHDALVKFGVSDTSDLFRIKDDEWMGAELQFKLGHKRKIIMSLKRLERSLEGPPGKSKFQSDSDSDYGPEEKKATNL